MGKSRYSRLTRNFACIIIALLCLCILPAMAEDATAEATAPVLPTDTIAVVSGEGEGNTIVNVGGETPAETPETPAEPMPWGVSALLRAGEWIVQLLLAYIVVVRGALAAVKAWLANPARVKASEDAVELLKAFVPDIIERAVAAGLKQAEATTIELYKEIRRGLVEATDGQPMGSKKFQPSTSDSVSSTGAAFESTAPRMPGS